MPLIHALGGIFKSVYALAPKLAKRDRYGIYLKIESASLDALMLAVEAALTPRQKKVEIIAKLSVKIETVKHLVRIAHEIGVIDQKRYIALARELVEASKMNAGWLKYMNSGPA